MTTGPGVHGQSTHHTGVVGISSIGEGVHGETDSDTSAEYAGIQKNKVLGGAGVYGEVSGNNQTGL